MKILIVDDNNDDRKMLRCVLQAHGHNVMEAVNGQEGLQTASAHRLDLIISDVLMPVMDGFQFLRNLRKSSAVPFVFYSAAYDGSGDMQLATSLGADGYLLKPKDPLELIEEIGRIASQGPRESSGVIEEDDQFLNRYCQVVASKLEEKVRELEETLAACKRTEERLTAREHEFRTLAENLPDNIVRYDREGRTVYVNPTLENKLGAAAANKIGTRIRERHSDGGYEVYAQAVDAVLASGENGEIEFVVPGHPSEVPVVHQIRFIAERGEQGEVNGVLAIGRDITERRQAESKLRHSYDLLRTIIDSAPIAIFGLNLHGNVQMVWNPSAEKMLGWSAGEIMGCPLPGITADGTAEKVAAVREQMRNGSTISGVEVRCQRRDGSPIDCSIFAAPLRNYEGCSTGNITMLVDISERRRAEQELLDRQQRLSAMVVELSLAEERERRRIAAELHDNIGQTLLLGKIKLGSLISELPRTVDVNELTEILMLQDAVIRSVRSLTQQLSPPILSMSGLEAALEWLGKRMEEDYGLRVTFVNDRRAKPLSEDIRVIVYQACRELLINVAKHAETASARVAVGREGNRFYLLVEDQGVGFDPAGFAPGGSWDSGFGLFSIRERIKHLGGEVMFESAPGRGTSVTLWLTLQADLQQEIL